MIDTLCFCVSCQKLFKSADPGNITIKKDLKCPKCKNIAIIQLNHHHSGLEENEVGPPPFEFVCHQCKTYFETPSTKSPDDTKQIMCPVCQNINLERLRVCEIGTMDLTCFG